MPKHYTVSPAYGRDYKSKKAVIEDWNAEKDFVDQSYDAARPGAKINVSDVLLAGGGTVNIRYDRMRKVCVVKVSNVVKKVTFEPGPEVG